MTNELKQEKININGKDITLTELSFAGQLRMQAKEHFNVIDMFKEMMSEEDFKEFNFENMTRKKGHEILKIANKLNGDIKVESPNPL